MTTDYDRPITQEDIEYARVLARFGFSYEPHHLADIVIEEIRYDAAAAARVQFALNVHLHECVQADNPNLDVAAVIDAVRAAIAAELATDRTLPELAA